MNKDDILKKSREENQNGDEREKDIQLRSYAIGAVIGMFLCVIFMFIENIILDRHSTPILIIYIGMMFSKSILDAIQLKKQSNIVISILLGLSFVIFIALYILDNVW